MRTCIIFGDLSSDRTGENYPTVHVCGECYEADKERKEDQQILSSRGYDLDFGDACEFCGKTYDEEQQEE